MKEDDLEAGMDQRFLKWFVHMERIGREREKETIHRPMLKGVRERGHGLKNLKSLSRRRI